MRKIARHSWSGLLLALLLFTACGSQEKESGPEGHFDEFQNILNIYNWEDYLLPELIKEFEAQEGIQVNLHTYLDEDDILAALQSGLTDADLVVVSDNIVEALHRAKLVHPLDRTLLPHLRHVTSHPFYFTLPGDTLVTVPYLLGTVGVLVNRKYVPDNENSWDVLWDPAHAGRIGMLGNSLDVIDAGCKALGFSISTEDPQQLDMVRDSLLAQRPLLAGYFDAVAIMEKMVDEELHAAQLYSGDAMVAMQDNPDLRYFVPREGTTLWVDCFVVPVRAAHAEAAMRFINFMHQPEVMARNARYLRYQPVNTAAIKLLPESMRNAPELFPPRQVLERCETFRPINAEAMRQRLAIWSALRDMD